MFNNCEFLVLRPLTSVRFKNFEDRYSGALPVMHLKAIVALREYSWLATGSQLSLFFFYIYSPFH